MFDILPNPDVVLWGSMIAAYAQQGYGIPALELFDDMQQESIKPSSVTFSCILQACGNIGAIGQGRLIHAQIIRNGHDSDVIVGNSLVDMYASCGSLDESRKVFDELLDPDMVSWNAMIARYAQQGYALPAMDLFEKMQQESIEPDKITLSCILKSYGTIGAIAKGRLLHGQMIRTGEVSDVVVGTTLLDMYAACGSLEDARKVFDNMLTRNMVSWCAMIAGYAEHGNWRLAGQCLEEMQRQGLKPDDRIYTILLAACSQAGQVEEGRKYFESMKEDHGIAPSIEHFNCMIDLLGRSGHLCEAVELLESMPIIPDIAGWMSLLTASRKFSNPEVGRHCFDQIVRLDPNVASGYVVMSDIYTDACMLKDLHKIQELKKCANAWKKPGRAWIEISNSVHEFVVGDKTHILINDVSVKTKRLRRMMDYAGYMPHFDVVLGSTVDEIKGGTFCG